VKYENYADAQIKDLFTATQLEESQVSELNMLESKIFIRNIKGEYEGDNLPEEIQYAPVYAFAHHDKENKASKSTFYIGGNQYLVKPQFGRYDASMGWSLNYSIIKDEIQFDAPQTLGINGQIRQLEIVNSQFKTQLLIGVNNQKAIVLQIGTNKKKNE
jgi:predicted phage-related endonuclease